MRVMDWLSKHVDGRDLIVVLSLALIAGGLAMVSPPAAFVVPGLLLFLLAVWPLVLPPKGGK